MLQNILNYQHFAKHKILVRQNIAKFGINGALQIVISIDQISLKVKAPITKPFYKFMFVEKLLNRNQEIVRN